MRFGLSADAILASLAYLRANDLKTFIVSGGGIEFMRPWTEKVYGIPPEQVIGSSIKTRFEARDGKPLLVRLLALNFMDDKEGKPVGINQQIGRHPIAALTLLSKKRYVACCEFGWSLALAGESDTVVERRI